MWPGLLQPSWFVQALLFQLCLEVNRVGGHALPRPTLHELLKSCLDQVLHHYHSITQQTQDKVRAGNTTAHVVCTHT